MDLNQSRELNKTRYRKADDTRADVMVDALCDTYKCLVGREPNDDLRDALWQLIRFSHQ